MKTITFTDFRKNASSFITEVEKGETFVLIRHGKPVAEIAPADARKLVKLLHPIRSKVNLIPFNEHPGSRFDRPSPEAIDKFQGILLDANMTVIIRHSKGQDIGAACGQLRGRKTPA